MATVNGKIILRQGNLADLPILEAGEQGYAVDARRLFIGNSPVYRSGDGVTTAFNFGVDLDILEGTFQRYEIHVDGVKLNPGEWTVTGDGLVVELGSAPLTGTGNVILYHNTELLTYVPDRDDDPVTAVTLPGTGNADIVAITVDNSRYDAGTIKYKIKSTVSDDVRSGELSIDFDVNHPMISDRYNTSSEAVLPHEFGLTALPNDVYVLNFTSTTSADATLSFATDLWHS